jgi:hypothetical protein
MIVAEEIDVGETRVKGPYVAETFPVTSDGTYLVVELPDQSF